MNTPLKIAIAEQASILRFGLEKIIRHLPGVRVQIIEIITINSLQEILQTQQPDILIINPTWLGYHSAQTIREKSNCLELKLVALLFQTISPFLLQHYNAQIHIYDTPEVIRQKIMGLCHPPFSATPAEEKKQELTTREKEVIICAVKGMTNREIADKLFLSTHTVITHRRNIARKLQIHSVSGLTIYAIVNKLVELSDIQQ